MRGRSANAALEIMTDRDEHVLQIATDRFERRLAEENGKLRVEVANGFGALRVEMATGFGEIRTEMANSRVDAVERDHKLLKWALIFGATLIGAVAGLLTLFR